MEEKDVIYPRTLRPKEIDLLESVLPVDRPGYAHYRCAIGTMQVLAQGRRGEGDLVLGVEGDVADVTSPLPPVIAYGMIETTRDTFSITVRELLARQMNVEIVSMRGEEIPDHFEEKRRWTYSSWRPGYPSPATGATVREVFVDAGFILAFAPAEQRIWMHDGETGMVHLLPITNYYNELMLHRGIRTPKIALHAELLWEQLRSYSDDDLRAAFLAYNRLKHRVTIRQESPLPVRRDIPSMLKNFFTRNR